MTRRSIGLRTALLIVAAVAVALATPLYWQKSREYRALADKEGRRFQSAFGRAREWNHFVRYANSDQTAQGLSMRGYYQHKAAYHMERSEQLERCARYPWLSAPALSDFPKLPISAARAAVWERMKGTRVRAHAGTTGGSAALCAKICRAFAAQNPQPAYRVARFEWVSSNDDSIEVAGWDGSLMSVTSDNKGKMIAVNMMPRLWSSQHVCLSTADVVSETYRYGADGRLTFVSWQESTNDPWRKMIFSD